MDLLFLHVVSGTIALIAGAIALFARKGAWLHRKSGLVFVMTMLLMSASGALIALASGKSLSVIAGALTFYLVLSSMLTVRPLPRGSKMIDVTAMIAAFALGIYAVIIGLQGLQDTGTVDGQPAQVAIIFGTVALLAGVMDGWRLTIGTVPGKHRLVRHLWRMCFALLLATASFFLGQAQVFPEAVRNLTLLSIPILVVLISMLFWITRTLLAPNRTPARSLRQPLP